MDDIADLRAKWQNDHDAVKAMGGLRIIATERHESRRIDNQLRGRSGRQGDPGSSRFYLSLDDALMRIFAGDRVRAIMDKLKMPEGEAIEAGIVTRSIESAQRKVEARNFDMRKQLLEYDDVSNDQRKVIYGQRDELLDAERIIEPILPNVTPGAGLAGLALLAAVPAEDLELREASIEDVVREEVRPLVKNWLDAHLPGMVERMVRAEIERVLGRQNAAGDFGLWSTDGASDTWLNAYVTDFLTRARERGFAVPQTAFANALDRLRNAVANTTEVRDGGLDLACLGMAEVDGTGNVNVSRFGPRLAGAGGFINISQNAKSVYFLGTFLAPARTEVVDGAIVTSDGPAAPKFVAAVDQRTFSGEYAHASGQPVMSITERCVFRLSERGMELIEIAPGVDLQRDVLDLLGFEPIMDTPPAIMDPRIFRDDPMGLREDLLSVPLEARFSYDEKRNLFFMNFEGVAVRTEEEVERAGVEIERRLAEIGRPVNVAINYDNFMEMVSSSAPSQVPSKRASAA